MYLLTLLSPMLMPSLSSSPWIRGAPQEGFSRHILRIRSRTSREMTGRPGWRLRRAQRRVARREKFSKRWKKAVRLVAKIHRKVFNQRNDFQHKLSREIVNSYGVIFVEYLNVKGLSRGLFSKSVHDAGWAAFFQKLSYKAESAGRRFLPVDPRGTSQRCPCGEPNPKRLSDREHVCLKCGLVTKRGHASANEILRLGLSLQPLTAVH
jgi:IS605 OrfB family transposase